MGLRRLIGKPSAQPTVDDYFSVYRKLSGWLRRVDFLLLQKVNDMQKERDLTGDVLEIGVFRGRSAILLGYLMAEKEQLVLCDLFRTDFKSAGLSGTPREVFEQNYLRFHRELPTILQCSSLELAARCKPSSFRLIHIDGGHSYDIVRADISTAHTLLLPDGVVVLDDYLNRKFPGVAAAVWGAVAKDDLVPICVTEGKMYATWSPGLLALIPELEGWARGHHLATETYTIMGRDVLKVGDPPSRGGSARLKGTVGAVASRFRGSHRA